jgi:hypothetical protein
VTRLRSRILIALLAGALAGIGLIIYWGTQPPTSHSDLTQVWYGAKSMLAGRDPYADVGPTGFFHWTFPLLYPMPAMLVVAPLASLTDHLANVVFSSVGVGLLAFALTGDISSLNARLIALAAPPLWLALRYAQWSPFFAAAVLLPSLGFLAAAKPTIGLAVLATRPNRRAIIIAIILVAASFVIAPHWLGAWIAGLHAAPHIRPAILRPAGAPLLLAALRWRRPEGRLLFFMSIVPLSPFWYEALPLALIPRTWREGLALACTQWLGWAWWAMRDESYWPHADSSALAVIVAMMLPCLAIVLRRPNAGDMPGWVERAVSAWPEWLRGRASHEAERARSD